MTIIKEPKEYDPKQCVYLMKPGFNPESFDYEKDSIDMMYFQYNVAAKLINDNFLDETFDQLGALFD